MLSSIPNELQSHILSYLPRKAFAAVARVSQHLHAVAIRILYVKVDLRSWSQVESFFIPGLLRLGPQFALEYAQSKREEWSIIRDLTIDIRDWRGSYDLGPLPRSLQQGAGLQLERLRLIYPSQLRPLLPLLRCLNPVELGLCKRDWYETQDPGLATVASISGWTRLRRLAFVRVAFDTRAPPRLSDLYLLPTSPFRAVTTATLFPEVSSHHPSIDRVGKETAQLLLRLCPALEHLRIVVRTESEKKKLKSFVKSSGKEEGFFAVEVEQWAQWGRD